MIKQYTSKPIGTNITSVARFDGILRKIVVKMPKVMPEVRLQVFSSDGELVHDSNLDKEINVYYPFNIIETITNGQVETQPFYISGGLHFKIEGLSEQPEDYITFLKFVYEE